MRSIGKSYCFQKLLSLLILMGMSVHSIAQETQHILTPWYVGVSAGMPFGISTFSSFGADKTRLGWGAGLYGGYHFNSIFSLEASATMSKIGLSAQNCCIENGYWLGTDGLRYNTPVVGMESYSYEDVMSRVLMQRYGLHGNANLLGLFVSTRESRWSVSFSPAVYLVGTTATLRTISTDVQIRKHCSEWHFGVGGDIKAEYRCTSNLSVGIYTGVTYLTGSRLDGVPEYRHKNNYLWESGIRVGWRFGAKRQKNNNSVEPVYVKPIQQPMSESATLAEATPEPTKKAEPNVVAHAEIQVNATATDEKLVFPIIYFSFDSTSIRADQYDKLEQTKQLLMQNADLKITIVGWCDANGSNAINRRYSLQRAQSVKQWLTEHGIAGERIETKGGGIDHKTLDNHQARRAQIEERKN